MLIIYRDIFLCIESKFTTSCLFRCWRRSSQFQRLFFLLNFQKISFTLTKISLDIYLFQVFCDKIFNNICKKRCMRWTLHAFKIADIYKIHSVRKKKKRIKLSTLLWYVQKNIFKHITCKTWKMQFCPKRIHSCWLVLAQTVKCSRINI